MSTKYEITIIDEYSALKDRLGPARWREIVDRNRAEGRDSKLFEEVDILRRELGSAANDIPSHRAPYDTPEFRARLKEVNSRIDPRVAALGTPPRARRTPTTPTTPPRSTTTTPPAAISPEWRRRLDEQIARTKAADESKKLHGLERTKAAFRRQLESAKSGTASDPRVVAVNSEFRRHCAGKKPETPPAGELHGLARTRAAFEKQLNRRN